jgi:hypothetical protein
VLSDTGNLEQLNASATTCCGKFAAAHAAQRKRTFSLKKKFTATSQQKADLWIKRANGINGG